MYYAQIVDQPCRFQEIVHLMIIKKNRTPKIENEKTENQKSETENQKSKI